MRLRLLLCLAAILLPARSQAQIGPWQRFQIFEWQPRAPAQLAALRGIGVTAGVVVADREHPQTVRRDALANLHSAGLRFDVENIATDFYSAYHRWTPHKAINWRFVDAQQRYRANPADLSLLYRDPSLSDPAWLQRIRNRLQATVRAYKPYQPLYYDLGDETGIADLTAFFDFDLSPGSLAGMRQWLHGRYGSLASLNAEWGTRYASWDAVQPEITRVAMQRTDGNYAPWSDFKAWMDVSYARALRAGSAAIHAADPHALAGMEGVQDPGWGGYNYVDLAHAVDLMEVIPVSGESLPLLHALNPRLIPILTSFSTEPQSLRRTWHAVLNGARGLVLWDENNTIVQPDGALGPDGKIYAPLFAALHRVGPVLAASTPEHDPIAILYSPESFRLQWMLDQQPKGDAWMLRQSETELEPNAWRNALRGYMRTLASLHLQPHFVTAAMLPQLHARVLVLPDTLSLSPQDAGAITRFAAHGGVVIADRAPGSFDGHGRKLAQPALPAAVVRIVAPNDMAELHRVLDGVGVRPQVQVDDPDGSTAQDVSVYLYHHGKDTVLALERTDSGTQVRQIVLTLPHGRAGVQQLLGGPEQRRDGKLTVTLQPIEPSILRLSSAPARPG